MVKKFLLTIVLFITIISLAGCGGSGSSPGVPQGVNPGIPSIVQMLPVQSIAQTNSFLTFKARILDGNGDPVPNEPVTFINFSSIGTFHTFVSATGVSVAATSNVVNTDRFGIATIHLLSNEEGFATVQAEVDTAIGIGRDRRTVFFTLSGSLDLGFFLTLDVDGDDDGILNETEDINLFVTTGDDTVIITATVFDSINRVIMGSSVTFETDVPYKSGADPDAACSDGSETCEVVFLSGNTATTNSSGEASVVMRVVPVFLRDITTTLNVTALADVGAFNVRTLFLNEVIVESVALSANPSTVATGETSTITAVATTNVGTPVPDGTTVNFTTTCGSVVPFSQTTDGVAEAEFAAPASAGTCTITGTIGTRSGTVDVDVTAAVVPPPPSTPLTVDNTSVTICENDTSCVSATETNTFAISGGVSPYFVSSQDTCIIPDPTVTGTFTVDATDDSVTGDTDVQLIVSDSDSPASSVIVTVTVTNQASAATLAVSSTDPVDTATGIALNSPVTITWNKPVDCSTVDTTSVTIDAGGWTLTSCNCDQAVFTPDSQVNNTTYNVTVGGDGVPPDVEDLDGGIMAGDDTFSYTTVP